MTALNVLQEFSRLETFRKVIVWAMKTEAGQRVDDITGDTIRQRLGTAAA